jgi:DNA-cytosine methyltransferase
MSNDVPLTHISWFGGVGGFDMGLEPGGWRTVAFSEIDAYACAIWSERWPSVPNLGDVRTVQPADIPAATLWTGGFPCQDLSVAGKRRGLAGDRSGLAIVWLDLVAAVRPAAIIIENVPGLLSSHSGRDLGRLAYTLGELGYWWAFRILDGRFFDVPQRRRRLFVVGIQAGVGSGPDSAGSVLSVGSRCRRHPVTVGEAGETSGSDADASAADTVGALPAGVHGFPDGVQEFAQGHFRVVDSPATDADRMRASNGMAGRPYDRQVMAAEVAATLESPGRTGGFRFDADQAPNLIAYRKSRRAQSDQDDETWIVDDVANTLNTFDVGDARTTSAIVVPADESARLRDATDVGNLLPVGLDGHRYRCCGNGVISPVVEWIGRRLAAELGVG